MESQFDVPHSVSSPAVRGNFISFCDLHFSMHLQELCYVQRKTLAKSFPLNTFENQNQRKYLYTVLVRSQNFIPTPTLGL